MTSTLLVALFVCVYFGIALGRIPGLAIDRTGVALLGAIGMLELSGMPFAEAGSLIDLHTLILLYALMVFSAQLRLGGLYTQVAWRLTLLLAHPSRFLAWQMAASALLSSLLANDIICLAFAPVIARACLGAGISPMPHLLGLAMAANIGSATTLIGNPQNMLIGQLGGLDFADYLSWSLLPTLISLAGAWVILQLLYRRVLGDLPGTERSARLAANNADPIFDAWQTGKGLILLAILVALFFTDLPRDKVALSLAALLLLSRRMHTRSILGLIDWHLLTLFAALFIVVGIFRSTDAPEQVIHWLAAHSVDLANGQVLTLVTALLSNLVSNVPATMLLAQTLDPAHPELWYVLAMASTFAGNLLLIGSIANLIVAEQVAPLGVRIGFLEYARAGVPVTLLSLAILSVWLLI